MTLYLDCNATTPLDPRVQVELLHHLNGEYGNAGSPHEFGRRAKEAVHLARDRIGQVVGARRHEVLFTSGATESNNIAILGLAPHGEATGKRHIVSTRIEHKAVLEPLEVLRRRGFEVTLIDPAPSGRVSAADVLNAIRQDTLLVSVMHVNNETGACQPIAEIAEAMGGGEPFFHVDAAQGFGKELNPLRHPRIDLISISSHKIHGPQGVGALVARRPDGNLPPLNPLMHGGGQELGLRPGTLPTSLIAAFGKAAELAAGESNPRREHCRQLRELVINSLAPLEPVYHGDRDQSLPHVLNISFPGFDADQVISALEGIAAVSDGSACTSVCATASHVLSAMGVSGEELDGAVRLSWSYLTDEADLKQAVELMLALLSRGPVDSRLP